MSGVASLVEELGKVTQISKELYAQYKATKETEDALREELMITLNETGLLTAKTPEFTASIVRRPNAFIENESLVKEWLESTPNIEPDLYVGIKTVQVKELALRMLKETGEMLPGTKFQVSQSLSIKSNSKKEVGNENN